MSKRPIVCVPCNIIDFDGTKAQAVRDTYIRALVEVSNCNPILLPVLEDGIDASDVVSRVDGFLFTGARSHVSPLCYGAERKFGDDYLDPARDATTLPLLKMAVEANKPIMAICRGFQELNVAMGGTLHQFVHELDGKNDHRGKKDMSTPELFEFHPHKVHTQKGGWLEKMGVPAEFSVNSIHEQGVEKLGSGLHVEALSDDGLVEAISIPNKKFVFGTQWHPEGDWKKSEPSLKIFQTFGNAIRS